MLRALAGKLARGLSEAPGTSVSVYVGVYAWRRLRATLTWSPNEICRKTSGSPARPPARVEVRLLGSDEAPLGLAKPKEKPEDKL